MKRCTLPNSFFTLKGCLPAPNLDGQYAVFITPGAGWPSCTPQAQGTHSNRLLRPAWTAVGLFFSPITKWGSSQAYSQYLSPRRERINSTRWDKAEFMYGGRLVRNSHTFNQQLISLRPSVNYGQFGDIRKDKVCTHRSAEKRVEFYFERLAGKNTWATQTWWNINIKMAPRK